MARDTYFTTIGALAEAGSSPTELVSNEHLVYSSPATLMYNSQVRRDLELRGQE